MARTRHIHYFLLIFAIVLVDQFTKAFIVRNFLLGEVLSVIPGLFNITYIRNSGVAFGMFANGGETTRLFLLIAPAAVSLALIVFYFRLAKDQFSQRFAVSVILGGAVSNLLDRFRLGYVVDFLDFHWRGQAHYPAFNAADTFICVGVFTLCLATRAAEKKKSVANV